MKINALFALSPPLEGKVLDPIQSMAILFFKNIKAMVTDDVL